MTVRVFVDTNVLVYARDRTDADKHTRALGWMAALWEARGGTLSTQVLHEYYVTVTRKLDPPRARHDAREDVAALLEWRPVQTTLAVIDRAWRIEDEVGLSWWDALIVSAAVESGARYLLTEDLQDGRSYDGVEIISPFTHDPEPLLAR